jgi:hypothetical protein
VSKLHRPRQFLHLPRQPLRVEHRHERIGIELLDVEHPLPLPSPGQHQSRADHRGHAGGVADRLVAGFGIGVLVVADLVDVEGLLAAAVERLAGGDVADVGLALGGRSQRFGLGQYRGEDCSGTISRPW